MNHEGGGQKAPGAVLVKKENKRRSCVKKACANCRRARKKCSDQRPCARCEAAGTQCIDSAINASPEAGSETTITQAPQTKPDKTYRGKLPYRVQKTSPDLPAVTTSQVTGLPQRQTSKREEKIKKEPITKLAERWLWILKNEVQRLATENKQFSQTIQNADEEIGHLRQLHQKLIYQKAYGMVATDASPHTNVFYMQHNTAHPHKILDNLKMFINVPKPAMQQLIQFLSMYDFTKHGNVSAKDIMATKNELNNNNNNNNNTFEANVISGHNFNFLELDLLESPFRSIFTESMVGICISVGVERYFAYLRNHPNATQEETYPLLQNFQIIGCNTFFTNMLGYTPKELMEKGWRGVMPMLSKTHLAASRNSFKLGHLSMSRFPIKHKSGDIIICKASISAMWDQNNMPQFTVGHYIPLERASIDRLEDYYKDKL